MRFSFFFKIRERLWGIKNALHPQGQKATRDQALPSMRSIPETPETVRPIPRSLGPLSLRQSAGDACEAPVPSEDRRSGRPSQRRLPSVAAPEKAAQRPLLPHHSDEIVQDFHLFPFYPLAPRCRGQRHRPTMQFFRLSRAREEHERRSSPIRYPPLSYHLRPGK